VFRTLAGFDSMATESCINTRALVHNH